jgi:hypothetical protein
MKNVLGWVKSNLIVVIAVLVALIGTPVMLFFSMSRAAEIREEVEQEVGSDLRSLQSVQVQYRAPSPRPGEPPIQFQRVPNEATTEALRAYIEQVREQTDAIYEVAEQRNREGKTPMLEGLFPEPASGRETQLRQDANDAWLAAHEDVLRRVGAGTPPDPESIFNTLEGVYQQRLSVLESQGFEPTPENLEEIRADLAQQRLGLYDRRADGLTFYADADVFQYVDEWQQQSLPSIPLIFDWQWRLWVHEELMEALALANTDRVSGATFNVLDGPVKRIVSVSVDPWELEGRTERTVTGGPGTPISLDYNGSITGRVAFPERANPVFDIRYAQIELIADSSRIPAIVDAFARANFMSVIDLDISQVDRDAEREGGFSYGEDHVVRLNLIVETVWLRSWTTEFMPIEVRQAIGAPAPRDAAEAAPVEQQQQQDTDRSRRSRERR